MTKYFKVYPIVYEINKAERALKYLEGDEQRKLEHKINDLKKQVIQLSN